MIKIKNLTKIYNSDKPVVALDNVSIDLPSKGLVFIVGKSGSGKSTLLNILGCLDSLTKGSIIADNIEINSLNDEDAAKYRNEFVGFIFQDYCLLDNLTVKENINLAFNIQNKMDDVLVNETISMMGLEGLEDRLPKTLSAGQKQRVAIARGYIKKPKLLLCDEPTGNLDSKTSAQILGLLKELSFTTLVVIVSHNLDDAYNYADRIIEISDGKIIDDISDTSNKKRYEIQDKKLYVSNIVSLSDEELNEINHELNKGNIKEISSKNNLFIESKELNEEVSSFELKDHHYSFKDKFRMSLKLQKKRVISSFIICLFSALIAVIFGLSQFFTMFDKNEVIK